MYESQHWINTPRTWQDINNSLDPTATSNWRLSSIKRYNSESRPSTPPFQASRRLFIEWRWWQNYIARWILTYGTYKKGRVSLRAQGTKTGDISLRLCMPQNKSCHVAKQGYSYRVLGKSFNDLSCLQNSLPTWLSPSLALWQCCQIAVIHGMLKKMTGSFNYLSCSMISDKKIQN